MSEAPSFLPDYSSMSINGKHRPLFKLFLTDGWRYVRKEGQPVECDSAAQAIEAAKECVKRILNPEIRAEQVHRDALADEVTLWRQKRAGEAAEAQEAALGAIVVKGRQVKVERLPARRVRI